MTEGTWQPEPIVARMASTRPVTLTTGQRVQFTPEALRGIAQQIRESFIPMTLEHVSFLAPIGRWKDAEVVQAPDGEFELYATAEDIRWLRPVGEDPDLFSVLPDVTELEPSGELDFEFRVEVEPRNFELSDYQGIVAQAPLPVREQHRWAELPPIEWILAVTVPMVIGWALKQYLGTFLQELGKLHAQGFHQWLAGSSTKARDASRDRLVTLRFDLPDGGAVSGFIPVEATDSAPDATIDKALANVGPLATFVGVQAERGLIQGLQRAAFIWDGEQWNLGWWVTDGSAVYMTNWLRENAPDPVRFLGHPILDGVGPEPEGNLPSPPQS